MNVLRKILLSIILIAFGFSANAQSGKKAAFDPVFAEAVALMGDKNRGNRATQGLLAQSFAQHLQGIDAPADVAALSQHYASYDPASNTRFTAGMLIYHLARPIALFRQIGSPPNEAFADLAEYRLIWLSGDPALALKQVNALIKRLETGTPAWTDPDMVSMLADAAVLAYRAGDMAAAQAHFSRANICRAAHCTEDLVFESLISFRASKVFEAYDPQAMKDQALAFAADDFPSDTTVLAQIEQEAKLMSGGVVPLVSQAYDLVAATATGAELTPGSRRLAQQMAERLTPVLGLVDLAMGSQSIAGVLRNSTLSGAPVAVDMLEDIDYFSQEGWRSGMLIQYTPLLVELLSYSDKRGDLVVAELLRIRLLLSNSQREQGLQALQRLAAQAQEDGFEDGELFSVLMDIWGVATVLGKADLARQVWQRTESCRQTACSQDLTLSFFDRVNDLPQIERPYALDPLAVAAADAFIRADLGADPLKLADLYQSGKSQSQPLDAARDDLLSLSFAESAADIDAQDLVKRAAHTMDTLVYAGRYNAAVEIGDRIEARVGEAALTGWFYQVRARAASRLDDPRAHPFYSAAIRLGGNDELALDLLDTSYLDLLDMIAPQVGPGIVARLRYRQGRFDEAADVLKQERLRLESAVAAEAGGDPVALYGRYWDLKALAFQEAFYREVAGDVSTAQELRALGGNPAWFGPQWPPLGDAPDPDALVRYQSNVSSFGSYALIRDIIEFRDQGNYQAAAEYLKAFRWVAVGAEANGEYLDAQTLWQMAFTFARSGDTDIAFDLMNRAARIAATLSFEGAVGAGGGTLQLLERDRWRYLLFVDIAWAAVSGQAPEDMLVVSRY